MLHQVPQQLLRHRGLIQPAGRADGDALPPDFQKTQDTGTQGPAVARVLADVEAPEWRERALFHVEARDAVGRRIVRGAQQRRQVDRRQPAPQIQAHRIGQPRPGVAFTRGFGEPGLRHARPLQMPQQAQWVGGREQIHALLPGLAVRQQDLHRVYIQEDRRGATVSRLFKDRQPFEIALHLRQPLLVGGGISQDGRFVIQQIHRRREAILRALMQCLEKRRAGLHEGFWNLPGFTVLARGGSHRLAGFAGSEIEPPTPERFGMRQCVAFDLPQQRADREGKAYLRVVNDVIEGFDALAFGRGPAGLVGARRKFLKVLAAIQRSETGQ